MTPPKKKRAARKPKPIELRNGWRFERLAGGEVHYWQKVGDLTTAENVVPADEWDALVERIAAAEPVQEAT